MWQSLFVLLCVFVRRNHFSPHSKAVEFRLCPEVIAVMMHSVSLCRRHCHASPPPSWRSFSKFHFAAPWVHDGYGQGTISARHPIFYLALCFLCVGLALLHVYCHRHWELTGYPRTGYMYKCWPVTHWHIEWMSSCWHSMLWSLVLGEEKKNW